MLIGNVFLRNYPVDGVVEEAPWAAYGSTAQAKAHFVFFFFRFREGKG